MKDFFLKMLSAVDPSVSSSRFLSIVTVITVLYTWMIVSIYLRAMQDIPVGVYTFVGLSIAGGVGNKAFERIQTGSTQTSTETVVKTIVGKDKDDNNR
jgi:hypothetical protein